jgi:hypothetical protein
MFNFSIKAIYSMKNIIPITIFFTLLTTSIFAGEPDKDLHEKCLYPSIMLYSTGVQGAGSGVILKSVKQEDGTYLNLVATCAHILSKTPAKYEQPKPLPPAESTEGKEDIDNDSEIIPAYTQPKIIRPEQYDYLVRVGKYADWSKLVAYKDFKCKIVAEDRKLDLALATFTSKIKLYTVDLDFSPKLYIGNEVHRIGCGMRDPFRLDFGRITSLEGGAGGFKSVKGTWRTSILSISGDSGGPVFHENKLIGITQAILFYPLGYNLQSPICHISYVIPLKRFAGSKPALDYLNSVDDFKDILPKEKSDPKPEPAKEEKEAA